MVPEIIFCKCSHMFKFFEVGYPYENPFYQTQLYLYYYFSVNEICNVCKYKHIIYQCSLFSMVIQTSYHIDIQYIDIHLI